MRAPRNPRERLDHAREVLELLFPGRAVGPADSAGGTGTAFAVAPAARHPRLLVPAGEPAARAALRAYGGRLGAERFAYRGYAAAVGVTRGRLLRPAFVVAPAAEATAPDVEDHLATVLGRPVRVAVHLTPPRANRKPIVQAVARGAGTPLGFAKLAVNPLTSRLLRDEGAALQRLSAAGVATFHAPAVLEAAEFGGRPILVTAPLPTWQRGRLPTPAETAAAAGEIAMLDGIRHEPLAASAYWRRLTADLAEVADRAAHDQLAAAVEAVAGAWGGDDVTFGAGHGDFSPWNMWRTRDGLLIWDWERFTDDAPVGSDLVHYALQEALFARRDDPQRAAVSAAAAAPDPAVGALHLLSLAVRYAKDGHSADRIWGRANEWLLPVVSRAVGSGPGPARRMVR